MNTSKITFYTRPGCPDSARASAYLRERGITLDEINIDADDDACAKVVEWTGRGVTPTFWIGDTLLAEPEPEEIDAALAKA